MAMTRLGGLLLAGVCSAAEAQVTLDPGFGSGGIAAVMPGSFTSGLALALQPDGRILLAGPQAIPGNVRHSVARLLPDGSLDPGFGSGGIAAVMPGSFISGLALALQPDGRILLAGPSGGSHSVARLLPDGSLDPGFGSGGIAAVMAGSAVSGLALALQPDGRILLAGPPPGGGSHSVARLLPDGSLDPDFGSGGIAAVMPGSFISGLALALQPDGRILLAGPAPGDGGHRVARLLPDGSLDPGFGSGGIAAVMAGSAVSGLALALQPDGRALLAGPAPGDGGHRVARLLPDGSLDPGFGSGGIAAVMAGSADSGLALALQPDGRILLAGPQNIPGNVHHSVARLLRDGSLDPGFGSGGIAAVMAGSAGSGLALALQPDGRILLAGPQTIPGNVHHSVARLSGPFAVAGRVWLDDNADGRLGATEPGVPEAWVLLREAGSEELLDAALTDADGGFHLSFTVPRRFRLQVLPAPFGPELFTRYRVSGLPAFEGDSDILADGWSLPTAPSIGAVRGDLSAGLLPDHLIGDRAWIDLDGNGLQNPGEPGLAGVAFELLDGTSGAVLASTTSSPEGWYAFPDAVPGSYRLRVTVPAGFALTQPNQGAPGADSDFDPATGLGPVFAYAGGYAMGFDAGFVPTGFIFGDGFEGD
jgi:uncharacterized delta-60 repeat protein